MKPLGSIVGGRLLRETIGSLNNRLELKLNGVRRSCGGGRVWSVNTRWRLRVGSMSVGWS